MSLLNKAKKFQVKDDRHGRYTADEMELIVAYLHGEVSLKQVQHALGYNMKYPAPVKQRICTIIRNAVIRGDLKMVRRLT